MLRRLLVLVCVCAALLGMGRSPATPQEPQPAPGFTLKDLSGKTVSLSDFAGKVVILDFWATNCPPCRDEIPDFIKLYDQYKAKGFEMVGIALDWSPKTVERFVKEYGINYTILLTDRKVEQAYGGIRYIPSTFVIDRQGRIRKGYEGYTERQVFEADLQEYLAEGATPQTSEASAPSNVEVR